MFWVLGVGPQFSGSDVGCRVSGLGFRVPIFGVWDPGTDSGTVSDFGCRVQFRILFGFRVSGTDPGTQNGRQSSARLHPGSGLRVSGLKIEGLRV